MERPAEVICLGSYSANAPLVEAHGRLIREKEEMWEQREESDVALAAPREEGDEEGEGEERGLNSSFPWVGKLRPVSCSSFFF